MNIYTLFTVIRIASLALMALSSGVVIFVIMKQSGNTEGVSAIQGSTASSSDSFYGKNRGKRLERQLKKWTVIAGIVLALSAVGYFLAEIISSNL